MITEICYCLLESLIIILFLFFYFLQNAKFRAAVRIVCTFVMFAAFDIAVTILSVTPTFSLPLMIVMLILILRIFYSGGLGEQLLISIMITSLIILTDVCTISLLGKLFGLSYQELVHADGIKRVITVVFAKLVYSTVLGSIAFLKKHRHLKFSGYEYLLLSGTFMVSIGLITILRTMVYEAGSDFTPFLLILGCVLVLNVFHFSLIVLINQNHIRKQKITLMEQQIEMQEHDIIALGEKYEETIHLRHDMRNYLVGALHMSKKQQGDEIADYLAALISEKIDVITPFVHTKNTTLEAIINSKMTTADKMGIKVHCVIFSEMENLKDIDVCILLANLFDNAIEACRKNTSESEISLRIWKEAGYYCIDLSNTVENDVLKENPDLKTTKKEELLHGYGLRTVREIVDKYNGILNFRQIDQTFHAYISLATGDIVR
ncbi:MAG: GHKL domain-containing protein [Oscillospiraceae bacterium]|nr:GHKL domain-containing protein [Oscillospiraceae bacterium]